MSFTTLKERCDWVKSKVSLKQYFDEVGVRYQDISIPHQIRCPFHDDLHASARFYPSQNDGSGSFFCWACDMGGDLIWFVKEWNQFDSVIFTLENIERMFDLKFTQADTLKQFYLAKARFESPADGQKLLLKHLDLLEVSYAGALRLKDPAPSRPLLFPPSFPRTPDSFQFVLDLWRSFDSISREVAQLDYFEAVERLDEWEGTHRQEIQKWLEDKVGDSKLEQ